MDVEITGEVVDAKKIETFIHPTTTFQNQDFLSSNIFTNANPSQVIPNKELPLLIDMFLTSKGMRNYELTQRV